MYISDIIGSSMYISTQKFITIMNAGAPLTPESYGSVYMTSNLVSDIGALTVRQYHRDAL